MERFRLAKPVTFLGKGFRFLSRFSEVINSQSWFLSAAAELKTAGDVSHCALTVIYTDFFFFFPSFKYGLVGVA